MSVSSSHGFALLALVLGVALIFAGIVGSDSVEANRIAVPVAMLRALPLQPSPLGSPVAAVATERTRVVEAEVRRGDTLSIIFGRSGLSQASLQGILDADVKGQVLQDIHPGQVFRFTFGDKAELLEFEYRKSPLQRTVYRKSGDDYRAEVLTRTPEVRRAFRHAIVKRSLYEAGQDAGISSRMILELANVLGGVMDFALDPRSGDSFSVLYEEQYLDGERIAEGAIIAVEYVNEGRHHTAFRFVDSQGYAGYFGADGVSMRKAFLRAPLDFTRVSSNFNMRRFHPIARVIRPHRGVDYAAPTGTPVYASGDGRVIEAGYSRGNGNYVYLQHDGRIVTRYLHLHKRLVKLGQRVSQGQSIGSVGATGLATGPHLHYEFLVDGAYRNPRTALDKLPRARTLDGAEIARFAPEAAKLASTIANYSVAWELAVANSEP